MRVAAVTIDSFIYGRNDRFFSSSSLRLFLSLAFSHSLSTLLHHHYLVVVYDHTPLLYSLFAGLLFSLPVSSIIFSFSPFVCVSVLLNLISSPCLRVGTTLQQTTCCYLSHFISLSHFNLFPRSRSTLLSFSSHGGSRQVSNHCEQSSKSITNLATVFPTLPIFCLSHMK